MPSINALRAFEAAARHLNFTSAGQELSVTAGAIRNHVRALERDLCVRLFTRIGNRFALSEAGKTLLPDLRIAFERMESALMRLHAREPQQVLNVRTLPTFASNWLVPRLPNFKAAYPGIDVRIDSSEDLADFAHNHVDILLYNDDWNHSGLHVEPLFEDEVFPVCNPALIDGEPPLKMPADLREHALLHVDYHTKSRDWPDWDVWLVAAGLDHLDAIAGPRFSHQNLVIQAAEQGQGVALGSAMAHDALAAGRLVRPFELSVKVGLTYCLFCPADTLTKYKVTAFRDWIVAAKPPQSRICHQDLAAF